MRFTKMEGLGNDYIYLNCQEEVPEDLPALAVRLSRRHFGVGADGLICIRPGRTGDFTMEMYNADGSRGAMCGNGIRCVGKYVYDKGFTQKTRLTIDTDAGPRMLELHLLEGAVEQVTVDMGRVEVSGPVRVEAAGSFSKLSPPAPATPTGSFSARTRKKSTWSGWVPFWSATPPWGSGEISSSCPAPTGGGWTSGCGSGAAGSPWLAAPGPAPPSPPP